VLAIFLFAFHNLNLLKTKVIASELKIEGTAEMIITRSIPESVSVRLRGIGDDIAEITAADIITYIDLSRYAERGEYRVPVQVIRSGEALNVDTLEISVEPVDIMIQLDKKAYKTVKIVSDITGTAAAGCNIVSENLTPDAAIIEGPASRIENIMSISTEPLDISGRYSDFSVLLTLVKQDPLVTVISGSPVKYSAIVRETGIEKEFSGIPVTAINLSGNFTAKITPESGFARLRGGGAVMENFVPSGDLLTVDCSGITGEGSFTLPVIARADALVTASFYEPETVTVEIEIRKQ
jgi:YbbR domain-containing protein